MRKASEKTKKIKLTGNRGGPDCLSGRFWTQTIEPMGAALLSETLGHVYLVVKNLSEHNVILVAGHGDLMDLQPGVVRATYARGIIRIENPSDKPALIEFELIPIALKP